MYFLDLISTTPTWFFVSVFFILGACIGSFLNVVVYRLPLQMKLHTPGSRCGGCEKPIPLYLNVPLVGWLLLKGRASCCGSTIPPRYFFLELITASLFALAACMFQSNLAYLLVVCVFVSLMLICIYTDIDALIIPDSISIGATGVSLIVLIVLFFILPPNIGAPLFIFSITGMLVGSAALLWLGLFTEMLLKKETIGFGDVKLLGLVGFYIGWQGALMTIFLGAAISLTLLISFKVFNYTPKGTQIEDAEKGQFPFGPGLCIAAIVLIFFPELFNFIVPS